jgi:hypothetical protein
MKTKYKKTKPTLESLQEQWGNTLINIKQLYVNQSRTEFITTDIGKSRPKIKMESYLGSDLSTLLWDELFEYLEFDEDGDMSTFIDILEDIGIEIIQE